MKSCFLYFKRLKFNIYNRCIEMVDYFCSNFEVVTYYTFKNFDNAIPHHFLHILELMFSHLDLKDVSFYEQNNNFNMSVIQAFIHSFFLIPILLVKLNSLIKFMNEFNQNLRVNYLILQYKFKHLKVLLSKQRFTRTRSQQIIKNIFTDKVYFIAINISARGQSESDVTVQARRLDAGRPRFWREAGERVREILPHHLQVRLQGTLVLSKVF